MHYSTYWPSQEGTDCKSVTCTDGLWDNLSEEQYGSNRDENSAERVYQLRKITTTKNSLYRLISL